MSGLPDNIPLPHLVLSKTPQYPFNGMLFTGRFYLTLDRPIPPFKGVEPAVVLEWEIAIAEKKNADDVSSVG